MTKEKEKKYLFCPKCKEYPDEITEKNYPTPFWQRREWNGECYEVKENSLSDIEYAQSSKFYCGICETELIDDEDAPKEDEWSCRKCGKMLGKGAEEDICDTCRRERNL